MQTRHRATDQRRHYRKSIGSAYNRPRRFSQSARANHRPWSRSPRLAQAGASLKESIRLPPMLLKRRWCKDYAKVTWHRREWSFPRSPGLALIALLALPLVWWYDRRIAWCAIDGQGVNWSAVAPTIELHDSILRAHQPERPDPVRRRAWLNRRSRSARQVHADRGSIMPHT